MFNAKIKSEIDEDICILIQVDNHPYNYICDCGDASNLSVKDCQNTNAIFLSHTHIDHFVNFDTILRHQIGIKRRVIICGPKDITKQVQSKIQSYRWNLIAEDAITYEIREIIEDGTIKRAELKPPYWDIEHIEDLSENSVFKTKEFQVDYTILDHKTQSIGYLFKAHDTLKINIKDTPYKGGKWINELKDAFRLKLDNQTITIEDNNYKAAELFHLININKGDTLGIILDHAASIENQEKIKQLFSNVDTVLIESFYKASDKAFAEANYHSYSSASGAIMKACNVKKAIPVHFSRKYKAEDVEELIEEFNTAFK